MSQNGHATFDKEALRADDPPQRASSQEVFRAKNARPIGPTNEVGEQFAIASSIDRLTTRQGELIETMEKVLSDAVRQPTNAPHAAVGPVSEPRGAHVDSTQLAEEVAKILDLAKLKATKLENGDVSYALPLDALRATAADLVGIDREAFREVGLQSSAPHIEVMGQTDRQVAAAMTFAKQRWAGDAVIIHADDKHVNRIVEHAVRAGLKIDTSRDPHMANLVTREIERQANPMRRDRNPSTPALERVSAGLSRAR